jgi:hypothetical protein
MWFLEGDQKVARKMDLLPAKIKRALGWQSRSAKIPPAGPQSMRLKRFDQHHRPTPGAIRSARFLLLFTLV